MHLILTEQNIRFGRYKNLFKITSENKIIKTIPTRNLKHIIIFAQGFSISSEALALASENTITLTICKPYGKPIAFIHPSINHPHILIRWSQYSAIQNGSCIPIIKNLIHQKIQNQIQLLSRYKIYLPTLDQTLNTTLHPLLQKLQQLNTQNLSLARQKITNIEAHASSIYWSYFKQLIPPHYNFQHRTHRHSKDPINSALNYGYGILYSEIFHALTLAGLDPYAGFLHTLQNNKQSLVYDFIEPFRQPVIDSLLLASIRQGLNIQLQKNGLLEKQTQKKLSTLYIEKLYEPPPQNTSTTWQKEILNQAIHLAQTLTNPSKTNLPGE